MNGRDGAGTVVIALMATEWAHVLSSLKLAHGVLMDSDLTPLDAALMEVHGDPRDILPGIFREIKAQAEREVGRSIEFRDQPETAPILERFGVVLGD